MQKNINEQIDYIASRICERIRDSRSLDLEDIKHFTKTIMTIGLSEVLRNEESQLAEEQRKLMAESSNPMTTSTRRRQINVRLQELGDKRKSLRYQTSKMENEDKYHRLRKFIKEKGHEELLPEFDNSCSQSRPFTKLK